MTRAMSAAKAVPALPHVRRARLPVLLDLQPGADGGGRGRDRGREVEALV